MQHFSKFISEAMDRGMTMEEALASPEAKAAAQRDDAAHRQKQNTFTKNQFLEGFVKARREAGSNNPGFEDHEEMMLAMSDPLYEKSAEYRAAVEHILMSTPPEVCGVSASAQFSDGTKVQIGRSPQVEVATKESMLENAYRDMIFEELGKLDLNSAKGRYEYMAYLADPKNAFLVDYQESLVTSDAQRTNQAMLDSQAAGHVDRATVDFGDEINDGSVVPQDGGFGQKGGE